MNHWSGEQLGLEIPPGPCQPDAARCPSRDRQCARCHHRAIGRLATRFRDPPPIRTRLRLLLLERLDPRALLLQAVVGFLFGGLLACLVGLAVWVLPHALR